ncbi:NlpC/P60 family protein [Bacillus stratosphericus]|nr:MULTISPECIES: NlpC/P60 family protein [Bacillus]MCA0923481.1 NlpC/P60 family protein [Bacillus stratosphericus]MCA1014403.1 NlpC/P60 family protein [Bacillus stratosphericus]MCA2384963.1 NlpC/P60 family protein [Bacillus stratosphericus]MCA2397273.1 NlpC/P60 family protein [Bacillus stratosphericus]UNG00653.1 NlpC/P60 family protein [Bacillus altitudinis]
MSLGKLSKEELYVKKFITFGLASVIGASGLFIPFTHEANAQNFEQKKQELDSKQSEVNKNLQKKKEELSKLEAKQEALALKLKEIDEKALKTSDQIEEKQKENEKTKKEIKALKKEIADTEKRIEERNEFLKKRVRALQESGGSTKYIDVLLGAKSFSDFISRAGAVSTLINADSEIIKEQERDKAELQKSENELNTKLEDVQKTLAKLETLQTDLNKQLDEKDKLFKQVKKQKGSASSQISELNTEANSIASEKDATIAAQKQAEKEAREAAQKAKEEKAQRQQQRQAAVQAEDNSSNNDSGSSSNNSGSSNNNSSSSPSKKPSSGGGSPVSNNVGGIEGAISTGSTIVGQSPYKWGGGRSQADIDARRFDCSSFVRWAFASAGINLGPVGGTTTDTLVGKGRAVSASDMKRGDLVFFDTYKVNGHVGIYLGNGTFLNDNSSHGVSVDSMSNPYWKRYFNGVVRRVVE